MCQLGEQSRKNLWDKETKQGKYHPDYDSYGKPSWKLKAGESSKPWIDDYVPMPKTHLQLGSVAGGPPGSTPVLAGQPDAYKYAQDKAAARQNKNRTSLSTNDSARG